MYAYIVALLSDTVLVIMALSFNSISSILLLLLGLITTSHSTLTKSFVTELQDRLVVKGTAPASPSVVPENLVELTKREDVAPGIELRILPLGDSITFGFQSTDGNGYRLRLQELLSGSSSNFIGSIHSGNMTNNNNEGHNGATIDQIAAVANTSLVDRPNIVLLHAGTNDLHDDKPADPYADAPKRLGALIDEVVSVCSDASVLVAQIVNNWNNDTESRIRVFNDQVPGVVAERADKGHHVMVADMRSINGSYLKDGLHPNDAGYKMMADIWFQRIIDAADQGWIEAPIKTNNATSTTSTATAVPTITSALFKAPTMTATTSTTAPSSSSTSGAVSRLVSSIWYPALGCGFIASIFS